MNMFLTQDQIKPGTLIECHGEPALIVDVAPYAPGYVEVQLLNGCRKLVNSGHLRGLGSGN